MKQDKDWFDTLILKDNVKGAVIGIYSMEFKKDETYRIDRPLAEMFFKMGVGALNLRSSEIEGGPFILQVKNNVPAWVQEKVGALDE